ncbi:MAG TPA: multicopper oxidase domain-containing protein, partial [Patescibacteria group bacterium]|nr:multicopper oxidase domain-containing protein [Patescibacteria group bacterium]
MKVFKKIILVILGILGVVIALVVGISFYHSVQPTKFINENIVFKNKLAIPPLLTPREENGEKVFDLTIQKGETEIFEGKKTQTWGYNGSILGPTIRAHTGDKIRLNVTNNIGETTTVHWHGMLLPASEDGGPHQTISVDKTWSPSWTVTNEAATLWYHPHTMERTAIQVYRGLAGFFIIDDDNSDSLSLPKEYGVDDIPLVVQDRKFDANAQLVYDHVHMMHEVTNGMLGNTILVNGTYAPYIEVPAKMIRLRLLNGSNARRYNFGFSDNRKFYQIASDGGLLPAPVERNRVQLSPGERAEILVDVRDIKDAIMLLSYPVDGDQNTVRGLVLGAVSGGTDERQQFNILEIRPKAGSFVEEQLPKVLNTIDYLDEKKTVTTREFRLDTVAINGKKMDPSRVDEIVREGDIEIWHFSNQAPGTHPIHIHGVQFQVLSRN